MQWLIWFLFESAATLAGALGLVCFWLLVHWRRSGRPRPLQTGLAVGVLLLIIQGLVVTRRERAGEILDRIETDLVAGRTAALDAALVPGFQAGRMNRAAFLSYVERQLQAVDIELIRRTSLHVADSRADMFMVDTAYQADVAMDMFTGLVRSQWTITFAQTGTDWQISAIAPPRIERIQYPDWQSVFQP
ncbi:MAG: hypothetical protein KKB50_18385 [Planctomycetes bacterium]|nr:hypothetical protein [Planctomycetota bacterium]